VLILNHTTDLNPKHTHTHTHTHTRTHTHTHTLSQVFGDTKRLIESFLDGFNVCLFAYGQTGSGKTFTMTGSPSEPGLTPRTVEEIFRLIRDRKHLDCKVTAYFVELYNDQLVDLLWLVDGKDKDTGRELGAQPPHLEIKLDANKMVYVKGSVVREMDSPEALLEAFTTGNAERHTGATNMNAESSRSHSIFSIMVSTVESNSTQLTYLLQRQAPTLYPAVPCLSSV
jgi:Kinesin motor domain